MWNARSPWAGCVTAEAAIAHHRRSHTIGDAFHSRIFGGHARVEVLGGTRCRPLGVRSLRASGPARPSDRNASILRCSLHVTRDVQGRFLDFACVRHRQLSLSCASRAASAAGPHAERQRGETRESARLRPCDGSSPHAGRRSPGAAGIGIRECGIKRFVTINENPR